MLKVKKKIKGHQLKPVFKNPVVTNKPDMTQHIQPCSYCTVHDAHTNAKTTLVPTNELSLYLHNYVGTCMRRDIEAPPAN